MSKATAVSTVELAIAQVTLLVADLQIIRRESDKLASKLGETTNLTPRRVAMTLGTMQKHAADLLTGLRAGTDPARLHKAVAALTYGLDAAFHYLYDCTEGAAPEDRDYWELDDPDLVYSLRENIEALA